MSEEKNTEILEIENINVSEEDLPNVISEQFDAIVGIDKRIKEAEDNCSKAKEIVDKMILAKALNQKDAINSTQDAVKALAVAQSALADAQKILFENQQKMTDGMRYLLLLGASNIAMTRIVICELEAKLKRASKEELSQKAREELIEVIKLLREQESAFSRQDKMSEQIKTHGHEIESIHETDKKQNEADEKHDALINENTLKNEEQDSQIQEQKKTDEYHDAQIKKLKILAWVGFGIGTVSLILAILALIIK